MNRFEALHALGLEEGASDEDITMALYGLEKAVGEFDFSDIPALQNRVDHFLNKAREAKKYLLNPHNRSAARQVDSYANPHKGKTRVTALVEKKSRLKGVELLRQQVCIYLGVQQEARRNSIIALLVCIVVGFVALRYVRLMMARITIFTVLAVAAVVASTVLTRSILTCRKLKGHILAIDESIASFKCALGLTDGEDVASTQKVPAALEAPVIDPDQDVEHEDADRKEA